ncbi:MAG: DUF2064 domain-containing protein [Candidatus Hodarchaeota archaeon]
MLKDTILCLKEVAVDFIPILMFFPENDLDTLKKLILNPLRRLYPEFMEILRVVPQKGTDMVKRFRNAFYFSFNKIKLDATIIIGSDTPHLQPNLIKQSIKILHQSSKAAVLGPSQNGGFYLLGHRKPFIQNIGMIFQKKSSYNELGNAMELLNANNKLVHILPEVTDVDTFNNLKTVRVIIKILSLTNSESTDFYVPRFTSNMLDVPEEPIWI